MNKLIASFKLQNKDENVGLERMTSIFFQTDFTYSDVAIWEKGKEKNSQFMHRLWKLFFSFYYQQGNSIGLVKSGHLNA